MAAAGRHGHPLDVANEVNDCCAMDALCARCADDVFKHLRGVAQSRGHQWAADLIARGVIGTWPDEPSPRALEVARMKVEDLTRDEGLRERLAAEAITAARRRWCRG